MPSPSSAKAFKEWSEMVWRDLIQSCKDKQTNPAMDDPATREEFNKQPNAITPSDNRELVASGNGNSVSRSTLDSYAARVNRFASGEEVHGVNTVASVLAASGVFDKELAPPKKRQDSAAGLLSQFDYENTKQVTPLAGKKLAADAATKAACEAAIEAAHKAVDVIDFALLKKAVKDTDTKGVTEANKEVARGTTTTTDTEAHPDATTAPPKAMTILKRSVDNEQDKGEGLTYLEPTVFKPATVKRGGKKSSNEHES